LSRYPVLKYGLGPAGVISGWIAAACGIVLLAIAGGLFMIKGTTVNPTRAPDVLVTEGIYSASRNPMYLGMVLILSGLPLIVETPSGAIFPGIFFFVMDRVVIPEEENRIEGAFGEAYRNYKIRTRRWI
jgi:protein-S-isoprenylcysteine O-methyltransferase Ste14